mmetsp:Transcript_7213/g.15720  ORF Transcript_7213/g.15720 Transcript_7213/m.15720 type:complete len:264 (-) Transcript_7213:162-953(-)
MSDQDLWVVDPEVAADAERDAEDAMEREPPLNLPSSMVASATWVTAGFNEDESHSLGKELPHPEDSVAAKVETARSATMTGGAAYTAKDPPGMPALPFASRHAGPTWKKRTEGPQLAPQAGLRPMHPEDFHDSAPAVPNSCREETSDPFHPDPDSPPEGEVGASQGRNNFTSLPALKLEVCPEPEFEGGSERLSGKAARNGPSGCGLVTSVKSSAWRFLPWMEGTCGGPIVDAEVVNRLTSFIGGADDDTLRQIITPEPMSAR